MNTDVEHSQNLSTWISQVFQFVFVPCGISETATRTPPNCTKHPRPEMPTLARQISNRSFKNKPNIFWWFIIINIIYYQLFITNKWACNILQWNHSFIYFTKISKLQKKWEQNSSSPVSRIGLERWKKEKSTRASKESCNIATYL